jgi:glucosamine-6-phosphate deaminase
MAGMDYTIVENYDDMCKQAARRIAQVIRDNVRSKGYAVLGLATGSTPIGIYKELVRMHKEEGLSFKNVITFNLDEYVVDRREHPDFYKDPKSYHGFMQHHLFDHVDIRPGNVHVPDGMAGDLAQECRDYERAIKKAGGIDIQLLGVGQNGHLGFCEPGSPLNGRTSVVKLDPETVDINAKKFGFAAPKAISMGLGTIYEAKELLLVASGPEKTPIMKSTARGVVSEKTVDDVKKNPALMLHYHGKASAIVDKAAGEQMLIKPEELSRAWTPGH